MQVRADLLPMIRGVLDIYAYETQYEELDALEEVMG